MELSPGTYCPSSVILTGGHKQFHSNMVDNGSDTTTQTQGIFNMMFRHIGSINWSYFLLVLWHYLRKELLIKELSVLRIISIIIPYQKGSATPYISWDFYVIFCPSFCSFHCCKITWGVYCQLSRTDGQHILPRTLTSIFLLSHSVFSQKQSSCFWLTYSYSQLDWSRKPGKPSSSEEDFNFAQ